MERDQPIATGDVDREGIPSTQEQQKIHTHSLEGQDSMRNSYARRGCGARLSFMDLIQARISGLACIFDN